MSHFKAPKAGFEEGVALRKQLFDNARYWREGLEKLGFDLLPGTHPIIPVMLGEDVLITGAGPIGIMAAAVARHAGARNVVMTDVNDDRLKLAEHVVPNLRPLNVAKEELNDVIDELDLKEGFDVGLEMSGNQQALDQMVEALVMGGKIALLGIPLGKSSVDWSRIVFKALTIKGVYGREMFETWYKMIAMLQNGLDVSRIVTHELCVDEFEQGFVAMKSGLSGKIVLNWN
ncbi:MAG: zinc-binding dehydrogenase [Cohaesibacter sp.]|nr:zinc-binding dehydrogenase [Cohaesibacter sp.]